MAKTLYVCPCCRALMEVKHPGPAPARIEAPCLRCGCPVVLTPADRVPADANRPRFYFEAVCQGCGDIITAESETPEPPQVCCPKGCTSVQFTCPDCGQETRSWGRYGPQWLPACSHCGRPIGAPPAGSGEYLETLRSQHKRFLFTRWLLQQGKISG